MRRFLPKLSVLPFVLSIAAAPPAPTATPAATAAKIPLRPQRPRRAKRPMRRPQPVLPSPKSSASFKKLRKHCVVAGEVFADAHRADGQTTGVGHGGAEKARQDALGLRKAGKKLFVADGTTLWVYNQTTSRRTSSRSAHRSYRRRSAFCLVAASCKKSSRFPISTISRSGKRAIWC